MTLQIAATVPLMFVVPKEVRSYQTNIHKKKRRRLLVFVSRPGCKGKAKLATRFSGYPESFQISFLRKL